jgi:biotin operon repressor
MSIRHVNWALEQELPTPEKFVLVVLANYANKNGVCWPSQETIGQKTGLSRASVQRSIRSLKERGLIQVEARRKRGYNHINRYYLNMELGLTETHSEASQGGPTKPQSEASMNHQYEPSEEPSVKNCADAQVQSGEILPEDNAGKMRKENLGKSTGEILSDLGEVPSRESIMAEAEVNHPKGTLSPGGLWVRLIRAKGLGMPLLSNKQKGQLSQTYWRGLKKGSEDIPHWAVLEAMDVCIDRWVPFTKYVQSVDTAWDLPLKPEVGFFVKFVNAAMQFAAQELAAEEPVSVAHPMQQIAQPKTLTNAPEKPTVEGEKVDKPDVADLDFVAKLKKEQGWD